MDFKISLIEGQPVWDAPAGGQNHLLPAGKTGLPPFCAGAHVCK